jgi:LPPG:FO 2-phospho-L-lactate transferase
MFSEFLGGRNLISVLAGGVGAAKLVLGLVNVIDPEELTIIVNTGDDRNNLYGLYISHDVDIIMYTVANIVDKQKGWGVSDDTFNCLDMLGKYSLENWFQLGDRDLATHIYRTWLLKQGKKLDEITSILCNKLNIKAHILPMTNQYVPTYIETNMGTIHFEEYLIKRGAHDEVKGVIYKNIDKANPARGVIEAINNSDGVIICPSNPIVSIEPIIRVKGIKNAIKRKKTIAVRPIVGDKPIKGPAHKLMKGLGYEVSALGVAKLYKDFIGTYIIDDIDKNYINAISELGLNVESFDTIMNTLDKKISLAKFIIEKIY